jgi:alkanesulfonate monooxygenase SsuD/methylene tetrahydromethanopterin reductase-like flavin-dependent oxidoreductase (luciferase family)
VRELPDIQRRRGRARARAAVRAPVAHDYRGGPNVFADASELSDELLASGAEGLAERLPERRPEELTVSGDPDDCVRAIRAHLDARADAVALFPYPVDRVEAMLKPAAEAILPQLSTKEA